MQGKYQVKNPSKYVGAKVPYFRSSWELHFFVMCDTRPDIVKWASEPLRIPYQHPITGEVTTYVPDFMIQYIDKDGRTHVELIEIKPKGQSTLEEARGVGNKTAAIINAAKWTAAQAFCQSQGIVFRVITEEQIFITKGKRNPKKRIAKPRKR